MLRHPLKRALRRPPCFVAFAACWILIGMACFVGCGGPAVEDQPTSVVAIGTVDLLVKFRDGDDLMVVVPCSEDSSVFSILEQAQKVGDLKFQARGEGETAFVSAINGVENEGAAGDNWVYRVNDELGDRSCGVYPVKPRDQILWSFGKYEPEK